MLDQMVVSRLVGAAGVLSGALLVAVFFAAFIARWAGRAVGPRWWRLFAVALGAQLGFAVLLGSGQQFLRAMALLVAGVVLVWLVRRRRPALAGWFALAVALPWTLLWGLYVVALLLGQDFDPATTVVPFLAGAVPAGIALVVALRGDPPPPEPRPDAPPGQPGSRRIGNLSAALRATMSVGPLTTAELGATLVVVAAAVGATYLPVPAIGQFIIGVLVGGAVGSEAALRAIPRRTRRALEAFGWLGEWEIDRAREIGAESAVASPATVERWLDETPERPGDGWLRWEMLVLLGRHEEAVGVAERMPAVTPYERFEQGYALDRIKWTQGADGDLHALRELAAAVGPESDLERCRAEVAIAVAEGQQLASAGLDAVAPLEAVRDMLPPDVGLGRRYVRQQRLIVTGMALVLGLAASLADAAAGGLSSLLR